MHAQKVSKALACATSAALITGGIVFAASAPAQADQFDPENAPPQITGVTPTIAMAPDSTTGDNIYTVAATVSDADTLLDLNTVTVCLYRQTEGDPACADSNQDARDTALLTWTRATDSFAIDATTGGSDNSYWELGVGGDDEVSTDLAGYSRSNYNPTASSMEMRFTFRVSEVAREGAWAVRVIANDGDAVDTVNDTDGYTMAHFSRVMTNRSAQDFGEIESEGSADIDNVTAGVIIANGGVDLSLAVGGFSNGQTALVNAGGDVGDAVTVDRSFALEADNDGSFDGGVNAIRVAGVPTEITTGILAGGTTEAGTPGPAQGFRLYQGGGIPRNGSPYSATVTVGVEAD